MRVYLYHHVSYSASGLYRVISTSMLVLCQQPLCLSMSPPSLPRGPPVWLVPVPYDLLDPQPDLTPAFPDQLPPALREALFKALRCPKAERVPRPFLWKHLTANKIHTPPIKLQEHFALLFGPFPEEVPTPTFKNHPRHVPLPQVLLSPAPRFMNSLPPHVFLSVMSCATPWCRWQ